MIKRKKKRKFFAAFLAAAVVMLAVQIVLSFPFETLAKQTITDSSESIYLLDGKADSSLTEKGIEGQKREIELQREQSKSEQKEEEESSETKKSTTKNSKDLTKKETSNKQETEGKSDNKDIALMAGGTHVADFPYNGLLYSLWSDGNAGIKGFSSSNQLTTVTIPPTVTFGSTTYKVVHIYENAFMDKAQIQTINFQSGSNLLKIESNAFRNCTGLRSMNITNCKKLQIIADHAFSNCSTLQSIDLTNCENLTTIEDEAFSGCRNFSSLKFPTGAKLRDIGYQAFRNCEGMSGKVLSIPDTVRNIGNNAFLIDNKPHFSEVHHKKVASVTGDLPSLESEAVAIPEEAKEYDSKVDSSQDKTLLHKGAKWSNNERTTAEIRLDYGDAFNRLANLDIIFVIDASNSMNGAATTKDSQGITHSYPRNFLTDDIVYDASKMLIDTQMSGYNNRVGLVAFEGKSSPLFKSNGFMDTSGSVKQFLIENTSITNGYTNYNAGLQGAIDMLDQHQSDGRIPAVIFLSDDRPEPAANDGIAQANILREKGVNVYPIAIYTGNTITQALKNISYDGDTAYIAEDTESFETIMKEVLYDVINHAEPLDVQIEDVLSEEFELVDDADIQSNFDISSEGGQVSFDPNSRKITWDLTGCEQGVAHTLKIKVKVKEGTELTATGILDTNDSMGAKDGSIVSNEQPKLERYLAHYRFEKENDLGGNLPKEVTDLLPKSTGGYGDKHNVVASDIEPKEVKTSDGRNWEFLGWDSSEKMIDKGDVTFVGTWRFKGYDFSFIKLNDSGIGLAGAEFSLYAWKGNGDPTSSDLVNEESISADKWALIDSQTSQANGRVDFYVPAAEGRFFQLVETKVPDRYVKPQGQWRFTLDQNGYITNNTLDGIGGQNNTSPPPFERIEEGEFAGLLGVINKSGGGYLPETGGLGQHMTFTLKAIGIWLVGMVLVSIYLYLNCRKERTSSKT